MREPLSDLDAMSLHRLLGVQTYTLISPSYSPAIQALDACHLHHHQPGT